MRNEFSISHPGWVKSLSVGTALVFAFWNLHKLRPGYTEPGNRSLEDERRAERKRMARELHDTLLQGLQGILLEFEVLSSELPEGERERAAKIERKLRHVVMDGRNAINALRLPDDEETDWMAAILEMGEREASDSKIDFTLKIKGEPWNLPLNVRVEVLAIVREGLRNAFEHSRAKTILVVIRYAKRGLKISIQDNGNGVGERYLELRQKEGHWGIAGMRERAEKLQGRLTFTSQPSKGTVVNLVILRCVALRKPRALITSGKGHRWSTMKARQAA
ncbi:sensor histidine kinase [Dyella agri]|uniref:Histidine kinase/HSP90-like ATPase domain-containing protein n=1 Tax=Dyella agri TaxID=1926869 RepID=A0ABW8KJR7_9GAMM